MTEIEQYKANNAVHATLGEYNNYFSEGVFVESTEPLFVKKNWVPYWLWSLLSVPRLSYFEHEQVVSKDTVTKAIQHLSTPEGAEAFKKAFNDSVNDPAHLIGPYDAYNFNWKEKKDSGS